VHTACRVCESGPDNCSERPGGAGVEDADMVIFVSTIATDSCGPSTGAHAVHCDTDDLDWCARC
jgi:hypothetical protein